jgi:thiol-disulfide isomerase/thioredoxin
MRRRLLAATGFAALAASPWLARMAPAVSPSTLGGTASWKGLILPALDGTPQRLLDGRGECVVNLWARWCAPCRRELGALQRWAERLAPNGLSMVTVALDDDAFLLREYVRDIGLTLPVLLAASRALPPTMRPDKLPQTLLLTADGRELRRVIGARDWDTATAKRELLGERAA